MLGLYGVAEDVAERVQDVLVDDEFFLSGRLLVTSVQVDVNLQSHALSCYLFHARVYMQP